MFSKIASSFVAFLAAAAAVNAVTVPVGLSALNAVDSTTTSISLSVTVALTAAAEDASRTISFTFGSADGTISFGSGSLTLPDTIPESGSLTVTATGTYSPADDIAKAAGEALLSNYAANLAGAVSVVSADGTFLNVPLAAPGVELIERLNLYLSLNALVLKRGPLTLNVFNPFAVPIAFTSLSATAVTPINGAPVQFGTITQNPLPSPINVPAGQRITSQNVTAAINLTLAQGLNLISLLSGGKSISVTTNATAAITLGNYPTVVTLTNKVVPAVQA